MLISICTPVMNRKPDLLRTLPARLQAAQTSPPVELAVVDYNSRDGLADYLDGLPPAPLPGVTIVSRRYTGRDYYHQAHAYNLAVLLSSGEFVCVMGADMYPLPGFFEAVRDLISQGYDWLEDRRYPCALCIRRSEFIAAGGYDERFEFYGPEDREISARLTRRGARKAVLPPGLISDYPTPDNLKVANYRIRGNKTQLSRKMAWVLHENEKNRVLQANPEGWGSWT